MAHSSLVVFSTIIRSDIAISPVKPFLSLMQGTDGIFLLEPLTDNERYFFPSPNYYQISSKPELECLTSLDYFKHSLMDCGHKCSGHV